MDNITLITAYFKLDKNKYNSDYIDWMSNLLMNLDKNLIIFTSIDTYLLIKKLRENYKTKTFIIITTIEDFYNYKYLDYYKKDHERDHMNMKYPNLRNPSLYMIWNEKLKFVERGMNINPYKTSYFAWIDIGYVRNKIYIDKYLKKGFPNVENLKEDKIYMLNIDYTFTSEDFKDPFNQKFRYIDNKIGGGFIIGSEINLRKMIEEFYNNILITYMNNDYFIGEDQTLYTSLYLKNPEMIKLIRGDNDETTLPYCEMKWFYFLKFLTGV